ncbi:unnamed protein product [Moneuplotes crassus]|uniref:Peptidase A1 domain-containing protein n=1 Tax=Euplotes crassus TaxID=5936 RepID=A0AAD1U9K2_EUPCR|nr:unnamed protein product [Moneuplotes crassus]
MKLIIIVCIALLSLTHAVKKFEMDLEPVRSLQKSQDCFEGLSASDIVFQEDKKLGNKRFLKSITKDITNFKDLQYYGNLFIGPERQKMTFIYDTGSAWVWFPTSLCEACPTGNLYEINNVLDLPDNEKARNREIQNAEVEVLVYGTGEVGGIRITEDVYIYSKGPEVVRNLVMLGIVLANGIEGDVADGILGLGPTQPEDGRGNFVTALKEQGIIDYEMFSFDFKLQGNKSKMIFGDIDRELVKNPRDFIWVPMKGQEDYWNLPLTGVYFGNQKALDDAKYAVIDTGSSTLALSENNFLDLMENILDTGLDCGFFIEEKFVACICENGYNDFPDLTLSIHGHPFTLEPADYIATEDNICVILVYNLGDRVVIEEDTIVLGVNFLRKFYTVFDMEKSRIGIYEHSMPSYYAFIGGTPLSALVIAFFFILMSVLFFMLKTKKDEGVESTSTSGGKMHNISAEIHNKD